MDSLGWLKVCAEGQTDGCVSPYVGLYLVGLLIAVPILFLIAQRTRDLTTSTLLLMVVSIAINITVGAIVIALRLPIYVDSIGTVLVGVLAGPWAGALTGLLSNLIWSLLPVAGGAGPFTAAFAPVALVIGLMAGFWASRGVFRLRSDDARVGRFLALAAGIAVAAIAFVIVQQTIGIPELFPADQPQAIANQTQFVLIATAILILGVLVAWASGRTVFAFKADDPRIRTYLQVATAVSAFALVFFLVQLLVGPTGWVSSLNGSDPDGAGPQTAPLGGADFSGLALDSTMSVIVGVVLGGLLAAGAWWWASRGENARLFPVWVGGLTTGLVAAAISAPIAAGLFGGVTGAGTDALIALFRTLGLGVLQSAFAQGLTSDPLDKTISYTIVYAILVALPVTVRTMYSRGETTVSD
jgi:energy-coupling factor transport system substrate-specific component